MALKRGLWRVWGLLRNSLSCWLRVDDPYALGSPEVRVPEAKPRLAPLGSYILLFRPSIPVTVLWWESIDLELMGDIMPPTSLLAVMIRLETPGEITGVSSPPRPPIIRELRAEWG